MALSRNIWGNSGVARQSNQRYRGSRYQTVVSNDDEVKRRLLQNFDNRKVDELLKRQKFAPELDTSGRPSLDGGDGDRIVYEEVLSSYGFETPEELEDVYGELYILGEYKILENFETRTNDEINGDLHLLGDYKILENFETRSNDDIGGVLFNVDLYKIQADWENTQTETLPLSDIILFNRYEYVEDWELSSTSGFTVNFTVSPPTTSQL